MRRPNTRPPYRKGGVLGPLFHFIPNQFLPIGFWFSREGFVCRPCFGCLRPVFNKSGGWDKPYWCHLDTGLYSCWIDKPGPIGSVDPYGLAQSA